jgi:hypothetical protein
MPSAGSYEEKIADTLVRKISMLSSPTEGDQRSPAARLPRAIDLKTKEMRAAKPRIRKPKANLKKDAIKDLLRRKNEKQGQLKLKRLLRDTTKNGLASGLFAPSMDG